MKILIAISFLAFATLQSCYVQNVRVVTLKSNTLGLDSATFLYSNDSFTVQYNYYTEGLALNMSIYNKLNKPLFIDWGQSSYIQGTEKYDYWNSSTTVAFNPDSHTATINQAERYSNIPPRTAITIAAYYNPKPVNFVIIPMKFHFKRLKPSAKIARHRNSDSFNVAETDFTIANTPLIFRNYLTLSYDPKFNTQFYLDQQFWVSEVQDMNANDFLGTHENPNTGNWVAGNPYQSNNSFFIRYDPGDNPY